MTEVLRAERLAKAFQSGDASQTVLQDVGFDLHAGELAALLGPSGSGKTTLLMCLSLVLCADAGTLTINGRDVVSAGRILVDPLEFRRDNVGFVFQAGNLVPFLTVAENVALMLEVAGLSARQARDESRALLDYLEVAHRADAYPETLSGGERQRAAIARAVATRPTLILADEPTAALDTQRGFKVMQLFRQVARDYGSTVLVVTHDERMLEGFDQIFHMTDGRLQGSRAAPRAS